MTIVMAKLKVCPQHQDDSYNLEANTHRFYGTDARDKALLKAQEHKDTNKRIFIEVEERIQ